MAKTKSRPPAYPQVEFRDDAENYLLRCRFCNETVDIPEEITDKVGDTEKPAKWTHKCGNVFKIIERA